MQARRRGGYHHRRGSRSHIVHNTESRNLTEVARYHIQDRISSPVQETTSKDRDRDRREQIAYPTAAKRMLKTPRRSKGVRSEKGILRLLRHERAKRSQHLPQSRSVATGVFEGTDPPLKLVFTAPHDRAEYALFAFQHRLMQRHPPCRKPPRPSPPTKRIRFS